ncbi:auxin-responsive protein IAA33 [Salvia hispanica]|uniref:auxin-responsive protein IAA33 n=1 Tax=Salvia hispanica TaxID=49212 RepID=UPI00200930AD|nr:auxin-responsive protein IAA33 [Salvia hispanica]
MNRFDEESLKHYKVSNMDPSNPRTMRPAFSDDDLVAAVVPPVTVVLEGRSICQRISLHNHSSYHSLARALRQMFVDTPDSSNETNLDLDLDLSNAIPGYLIAYEDIENDLLLVGDLNWKDFVRVAKRIRILPVKAKSRKHNKE